MITEINRGTRQDLFYTPVEVAAMLGTSPVVVRHNIKNSAVGWDMRYQMRGNRMKIYKSDVDKQIKDMRGEKP